MPLLHEYNNFDEKFSLSINLPYYKTILIIFQRNDDFRDE
jgi:hypothetical protein